MRVWLPSAIYRLPAPSSATAVGRNSSDLTASSSSPDEIQSPLPATVLMVPGRRLPSPPVPIPDRYVVPKTLLLLSRAITAPRRRPGYLGVNSTDCVQIRAAQ